ncbi:unnamed protein product, partial [Ectocarpus sp. 6 AP-2014]
MHLSKKATPPADASSVEQCSSALVVSPTGSVVDLAMSPTPPTPERRPRHATTPSSRPVSKSGTPTAPTSLVLAGGEGEEAAPSRFKRVLDKATGKHYYYDRETKETFWTLADAPNSISPNLPPEDPRKRRKTYGLPPTHVEAVAQNQGAVVWWKLPSSPEEREGPQHTGGNTKATTTNTKDGNGPGGSGDHAVESSAAGDEEKCSPPVPIGFVVYRYRLDGREWHKKGATSVDDAKAVSTAVKALSNGLVYRFTVASRTAEGDSAESEPSVAVRPNEPLPEGWKENFNATTGKSVYTNVKTGQTSSERPECNPYFVETDLFLRFTPEETETLSEEFRTMAEMQSSTLVAIDDIMDVLPRIGEPLREVEVVRRLKAEGWEGVKGGRDLPSVTYRQFLALLWGIKGPKSTRRSIGRRVWDAMVASVTPNSVSSRKLALIEQDPGKRMGNWEKLVHPVVRRAYFVNKDTGQASWTTPAEVKFFLNDKLRQDLLKTTFSEEELAGLQKAFAKMDLDGNGTIDADELGLVLESFGEAVPPGRLKALIREVDHDGSDCIDFEEFTVMMSAVKNGRASLGWGRIN